MVYRSSKVVKSFPVAWIVVPFMTMSSSLRPTNGNLGLILAIKMKLINSPKIHKFRTSLLQRSIRFVTVTFKNIAFSSLFQLYLWDPLVLVSQSTFKMYFSTNFLGKTTWRLRLVSVPKLIATKFKILLTWNLTRSELVFTVHVLVWNVSSLSMILICQRKKNTVPNLQSKFWDNLWHRVVGMITKTRSILSVPCKIL